MKAWVVMTIFLIFQVSALNPEVLILEIYEDLQYQVVSPTHWLFYLGFVENEGWDILVLSEGDHMKLWFTWQLTHDTMAWAVHTDFTGKCNLGSYDKANAMQCHIRTAIKSNIIHYITITITHQSITNTIHVTNFGCSVSGVRRSILSKRPCYEMWVTVEASSLSVCWLAMLPGEISLSWHGVYSCTL